MSGRLLPATCSAAQRANRVPCSLGYAAGRPADPTRGRRDRERGVLARRDPAGWGASAASYRGDPDAPAGCSLAEIGQVLRHEQLRITAIDAKVDYAALRTLALPWPEGGAA
jgi:hypothetical protein